MSSVGNGLASGTFETLGRALAFGIATLASIGFVASLVVHGASLVGINLVTDWSTLMLLHGGVFLVFIPLFLAMISSQLFGRRRRAGFSAFGRLGNRVLLVLFVYAIGNFIWCMGLLVPESSLGPVVAQLGGEARPGSDFADPLSARAFSGHWLVFYFAPLAYFARRALSTIAGPSGS